MNKLRYKLAALITLLMALGGLLNHFALHLAAFGLSSKQIAILLFIPLALLSLAASGNAVENNEEIT